MKNPHSETARLCRGLALLLHSGIGLADGIWLLAEDADGAQRALLAQLGEALNAGEPLSAAMAGTGVFPSHVTGMVQVGEQTGCLEQTLESLARFHETRQQFSRRLRQSVAYPAMILVLMLVVIGVLLVEVLPIFEQVYVSLGSRLTGLAAGLLHLGKLLQRALPVLFWVLAAAAAAAAVTALLPPVRQGLQKLLRRLFGDRGISRKYANARFAGALALCLRSGLPLEQAMALAEALLSDNPGAALRCRRCAAALERGAALSGAMDEAGLLTASQSRMLSLGLRSGSADRVMEELAAQLAEEADDALERFSAAIEPTMVLAASLLVGAILLSVMLPLLHILSVLG